MCGIIGSINRSRVDLEVFEEQLRTITHRGPDDSGIWTNEGGTVALGSRRLAIQDLSANGHMPMLSKDARYVVVFNGEIYNYPDLKLALQERGFSFKSNSDTEAVLYAYMFWGHKCLEHLEGMFAVAVYDNELEELFIARDRVGEKPLYFWEHSDGLEFGSELKVLFANPKFERRLNPQAFYQYLEHGYCRKDVSFIQGVKKLKAGHYLHYKVQHRTLDIKRYWAPPAPSGAYSEAEELLHTLDGLLSQSVKRQLISDVPLGVLLSGGVDSSLITAYAAEHSNTKIKTFHISFDGFGKYNEKEYARTMADYFDTEHTELSGNDLSFNMIDELMEFYDEPLADSSMLPTYLVSRLTKEHVTVALGGDGGDELFGGYTHYPFVFQHPDTVISAPFRKVGSRLAARLPVGMKGRNYLMALNGTRYDRFMFNRLYDTATISRVINADYLKETAFLDYEQKAIDKSNDIVYDMTRFDFENNLTDDILVKVDRASMGVSLEMRAPWLDKSILEFAFRDVPSHLKTDGVNLKILPKLLLKSKLKFNFDLSRKQGFSIPLHDWIKGRWEDDFRDGLNALPDGLFNKKFSYSMLNGIKKGYTNSAKLYALLIIGKWMEKYKIQF